MIKQSLGLLVGSLLLSTPLTLAAQEASGTSEARNAYFGDLHLHTSFSFDAYVIFGARSTPEDAYRFARGETIEFMGRKIRRNEPLDFLAVTDHSENIGVFNELDDPNSAFSKSPLGQKVKKEGKNAFWDIVGLFTSGKPLPGFDPKPASQSAWQREIAAANDNYRPGSFTTFIGYEWSSMPQGKYNLHRNVIFSGSKAPFPFSSLDSNRPEDLWAWLEGQRAKGIEALAIAHNANASGGLMFGDRNSEGKPIDEAYAVHRVANEPLNEISQNKGSSETHPALSSNDEFAGFEILDRLLIGDVFSEPHGSYAREALGQGLEIEKRVGANPYKFGFVGANDFHSGLSSSRELDYAGDIGGDGITANTPTKEETQKLFAGGAVIGGHEGFDLVKTGSGNITGVWAEKNTRESIYAALRRKETFATSGPRIKLRFFGSWSEPGAVQAQAVPMGGDLKPRPTSVKAPSFAVWALKDPNGANLDRAQIIKVWLGKEGQYQERIYDVALSDGRKVDATSKRAPAVGNTVDLKTANYTNSIGHTELRTVWQDPDFDTAAPAVYYLRVIEIPTPRWSTLLAVKRGLPLTNKVEPTLQERAWSSPIWYTPKAK